MAVWPSGSGARLQSVLPGFDSPFRLYGKVIYVDKVLDLDQLRPRGFENPVLWDGKDLAAIQAATGWIRRENGRPAAEVDRDWNLTVKFGPEPGAQRAPVRVGEHIQVGERGHITVAAIAARQLSLPPPSACRPEERESSP
jgi:hypothetical protein